MLGRSPWETCSFLKKERGGVDLKERVNSGVGLRGVEGGETKVRMYWKRNNLGKERIKKEVLSAIIPFLFICGWHEEHSLVVHSDNNLLQF